MRALVILLLFAGSVLAAGEAPEVRVEVDAPAEVWTGQAVPVTLRVLVDLEAFEASSVQLFPRAMDLQLKVTAPWATTPPAPPPEGAETLSLVLNDEVVVFRRAEGPDGLAALEARWVLHPEESVDLAAPTFAFVCATEFEDDFVSGRRPLDRHPVSGSGPARRVTVKPVPEAGRPANYRGAVGRFTIRGSVDPAEVAVRDELKLTLSIEGEGNLTGFETPAVAIYGFHVLGRIDDRAAPVRTIVVDLTPTRGGIDAIEGVGFSFFDPEAGAYRTVTTGPIPVRVTGSDTAVEHLMLDEEPSAVPWLVLIGLALLVLVLIALGVRARPRKREPASPSPAEIFRERAPQDVTAALTTYLATLLGCRPAAVISPDLAKRLAQVGVPAELAERAGALVADLVGARYGGEGDGDGLRRAMDLVDELELC